MVSIVNHAKPHRSLTLRLASRCRPRQASPWLLGSLRPFHPGAVLVDSYGVRRTALASLAVAVVSLSPALEPGPSA